MERELGHRRVQCTGRGSYVISLPKEWVRDIGLEKGSEVALKLQNDASLALVPRKITEGRGEDEKPKLKEHLVIVKPKEDPRSLCRKIISLYVASADVIRIRFRDDEGSSRHKVSIKKLARDTLLGLEIVDETPDEITLQTLINQPEFLQTAIRRMAIRALSAIRDAILALRNVDQGGIQSVIDAYNDVNRSSLYVIRQLGFGLEHNLFKESGFRTPKEFLGYGIVCNDIKGIADDAVNIANRITAFKGLIERNAFKGEIVDEELYSRTLSFFSSAHELFEESLKAMLESDYEHADEMISKLESLVTLEEDLVLLMSNKNLNVSPVCGLILDSSRRIVECSRNIAGITLNRTVEEISSIKNSK